MKEQNDLVERIAKRIDLFAEHVGYGDPSVTRAEAMSYIEEIEPDVAARLLSDEVVEALRGTLLEDDSQSRSILRSALTAAGIGQESDDGR